MYLMYLVLNAVVLICCYLNNMLPAYQTLLIHNIIIINKNATLHIRFVFVYRIKV